MIKGFSRIYKPLEMLHDDQVNAIHNGTLEILEITGIRVEHKKALDVFGNHGCKIDIKKNRVRIPSWLVLDCLRKTPSSFVISSRDPKKNMRIGGNITYFGQNASMSLLDINTWEPTASTLKQHNEAIIIMDALENLAFTLGYEFYMDMVDVPPVMVMIEGVASAIKHSAKITSAGPSNNAEKYSLEIAQIAGTDILLEAAPSPPLTLSADFCEGTITFAEANMPMIIVSGAVMGGTGPATFAGSTVSNNAEIIAGIVLAQLTKPGSKIIAGDFVFPMNMTNGSPDFGSMGVALHTAIFNQIWRKYNIPSMSGQAAYSNSKKIDWQNGAEKALMLFASAVSGTNYISIHGCVFGELTWHPVQAIIDDEICGWVGRFLEGAQVNNETLALELIHEIGPIPGHFLNTDHTRKWWRREQFVPTIFDKKALPEWLKSKKDILDLAKAKMQSILSNHKPEPPLSPEQEREINEVLEKARMYYKSQGLI